MSSIALDTALWLAHALPLAPFVSRGALIVRFAQPMGRDLPKGERDVAGHKAHISALTGLSFSGVVAFLVLDAQGVLQSYMPTYFVLVSFVALVMSLRIQDYKFSRRSDQVATAFTEVGILSLLLALLVLLINSSLPVVVIGLFTIVITSAWVFDHVVRVRYQWNYLAQGGGNAERQIEGAQEGQEG